MTSFAKGTHEIHLIPFVPDYNCTCDKVMDCSSSAICEHGDHLGDKPLKIYRRNQKERSVFDSII